LEVIEDHSSYQAGSVSVGFESVEDFVSGDRLRMGSPRIIVRSSSNECIVKKREVKRLFENEDIPQT
jgi:hypothetical protein